MTTLGQGRLPENFRRLGMDERRGKLAVALDITEEEAACSLGGGLAAQLADIMVESAVGVVPVPLGVASGFLIDGQLVDLPLAIEEPSVIAAATFAGHLVARSGGFTTWATEPVMSAQIYLSGVDETGLMALGRAESEVRNELEPLLASLERRGGGFRGYRCSLLTEPPLARAEIQVDVRDAMGANLLNSAAEALRPLLERLGGGRVLMCILSNAASDRRAGASFSLPLPALGRALGEGWEAADCASRIVLASRLARSDPARAVTHNKGILNGIGALALATCNDWRAIEAAAHAWAARDGAYRGLGSYRIEEGCLRGELELPLPFATVGGAVSLHPSARLALRILGEPSGPRLSRIAAALGLAQNLAALIALVTGGIQRGHMRFHAARLAYLAGARGEQVRKTAELLAGEGSYDLARARSIVAELDRVSAGGGP